MRDPRPAGLVIVALALATACSSSHLGVPDPSIPDAAPRGDAPGTPCGPGLVRCGARCIDVTHEEEHCGACGRACAAGERCVSSECTASCGGALVACGGECVDPAHDPAHCGGCGHACAAGEICDESTCALVCAGGAERCGDRCVDLAHDPANCGACGRACAAGDVCVERSCVALCTGGAIACGTTCVHVAHDADHCGGCDQPCAPDHACLDGTCVIDCPAGRAECGRVCSDLASDPAHCGACDQACAPGEVCVDGGCTCAPGELRCGGACTDPSRDPAHCGACDRSCPAGESCIAGSCAGTVRDWPTLGGGPARGGLNAGERGVPPLTRAWGVAASGVELRPVTIAGGLVHVTSNGRFSATNPIRAYALADGSLRWEHDFGDSFSVGQPSVADGVVYVQQNSGTTSTTNIWALDADDGTVVWHTRFGSQWETFWAPLVVGDTVYANGGTYGGLYGFARGDGHEIFFSSELEQYDEWAPAWHAGSVYSFVEGHLRQHDPATGAIGRVTTVPWSWAGWSMESYPAFDGGRAYVVAPPSLIAIDASTGAVLWSVAAGFSGAPAASGGTVYALSSGHLAARRATDGTPIWTFDGDGGLAFPPVLTATHAYVSSAEHVYALDRSTGAMVWTAGGGGWLSIGAGHLLVAGTLGTLTAYRLSTP